MQPGEEITPPAAPLRVPAPPPRREREREDRRRGSRKRRPSRREEEEAPSESPRPEGSKGRRVDIRV